VVHAGGSRPARRWPAPAFGALAEGLLERVDAVVLTGGDDERDVTRIVRHGVSSAERHRILDVAGGTSVGSLAALLAGARVVVSNDTGVAHLAAAVDAPTVTVFATPDHERWRPRGFGRRSVGEPGRWPTVAEVVTAVDAVIDQVVTC
jgi:ADP-heptose:LPS heptosyltransferase